MAEAVIAVGPFVAQKPDDARGVDLHRAARRRDDLIGLTLAERERERIAVDRRRIELPAADHMQDLEPALADVVGLEFLSDLGGGFSFGADDDGGPAIEPAERQCPAELFSKIEAALIL
jgi:hypothetical protein